MFEKLYSVDYLEKHKILVFLISVACTVMGIFASLLLFRGSSGLSLAFITLLLLATLNDLIQTKLSHHGDKRYAFSQYLDTLLVFSYIFAGIMLPFIVYSVLLPEHSTSYLFTHQYQVLETKSAEEIFRLGTLESVFGNNLVVFGVCFAMSVLFGLGGMFLFIVIWNASVIGVVFAVASRHSAEAAGIGTVPMLLILLAAALPHLLFEILGYFIAGASGERLSSWLMHEGKKKHLQEELTIILIGMAIGASSVFIGSLFEKSFAPFFISLFL